ncbi:hypothetical protein GJ496_008959 [Pomphorhynchus laevis]|nr:hypothetical protein GJ496_008959 [Pomphorhynchus laevis]
MLAISLFCIDNTTMSAYDDELSPLVSLARIAAAYTANVKLRISKNYNGKQKHTRTYHITSDHGEHFHRRLLTKCRISIPLTDLP